ncbi:MAG: hypothetical protein IPK83_18360 [Planctomycetes bacterium]|nr:hypothetical protein [Planctomycetota bacterium]
MNTVFPIGFPAPTALYLTLFVTTLLLHVVFMNYVLAGTAFLALAGLVKRKPADTGNATISSILRDWMPFAVSAAITMGVAPILFVQILYKENFYTANLLLFHRWMSIVPVLIVGFYLTYLLKSNKLATGQFALRIVVGFGAAACFGFTALSWTENHLLSLDRAVWTDMYAKGDIFYRSRVILPRLAMWFCGAFPTLATLVAWQLFSTQKNAPEPQRQRSARHIALIAAIGLTAFVASAIVYFWMMPPESRHAAIGPMSKPYLFVAGCGVVIQLAAWHLVFHRRRLTCVLLQLASFGALGTILGTLIARESIRISAIDFERLYSQHADAATKGGLLVFVAFAVVNAAAIAWCFRLVRRGRVRQLD